MICSLIICSIIICGRISTTVAAVELTIFPTYPVGYAIRRVGDSLNITCVLNSTDGTSVDDYQLSWRFPTRDSIFPLPMTTGKQVITDEYKSTSFAINPLEETDSGVYVCRAVKDYSFTNTNHYHESLNSTVLQVNVTVKIKPRKGSCSLPFFQCGSKECLPPRYVCDGKKDCRDGRDEDSAHCGSDPCENKLKCENGRCRAIEVCCDLAFEIICQAGINHDCCKISRPNVAAEKTAKLSPTVVVDQQINYDGDMGFLQSTVYTIIGCAVAFIFIVTIMVVAVCRVHMKQSAMTTHPSSSHPIALMPFRRSLYWSRRLNDDENYVRRRTELELATCGGLRHYPPPSTSLLFNYNISNEVQFVGRFADPPPYNEVTRNHPPPSYGPPPPYESTDNVHQESRPPSIIANNLESSESTVQINDSVV